MLNHDYLKDTEGNRQGYPLRTYAAGAYLNGYSDHFPVEIFLVREGEFLLEIQRRVCID